MGRGDFYDLKTKINLNWIHFLPETKHDVSIMNTSRPVLHWDIMYVAYECLQKYISTLRAQN
jgi:hypothetical protein